MNYRVSCIVFLSISMVTAPSAWGQVLPARTWSQRQCQAFSHCSTLILSGTPQKESTGNCSLYSIVPQEFRAHGQDGNRHGCSVHTANQRHENAEANKRPPCTATDFRHMKVTFDKGCPGRWGLDTVFAGSY
jgi:hypothetical protein